MTKLFKNRIDAGNQLAMLLEQYKNAKDVIILALPRGGVPVAYQIASRLNLPLDLFIVRKLGFPSHEEFAIGAIAGNDVCIFNERALENSNLNGKAIEHIIDREAQELKRRNALYRQNRSMPNLHIKKVILVDDGIATGASVTAAILALEKMLPKEIILAIPVLSKDALSKLKNLVSTIFYLHAPQHFGSVGGYYSDFNQVSDNEVLHLLQKTKNIHYL